LDLNRAGDGVSVVVEDEAVILRSFRYGDTSRIVVFLSGRFGKIHAIAKGARTPRSGFGAALDILAESRLIFYLKVERELQLIRKADLIHGHRALLDHPVRYHYGCAAVEFADRLVFGEGDLEDPASLLRSTLSVLETAGEARLGAVFKAFQLQFATHLGYRPHVAGCLRCPPAAEARSLRFAIREGGLVCPRHQDQAGETVGMSPEAVAVLRRLTETEAMEGLGSWDPGVDPVIERVAEGFLRFHIDGYRGLRSLKSLRDLRSLSAVVAGAPAAGADPPGPAPVRGRGPGGEAGGRVVGGAGTC
jgi:DNA repair protein RecO (recombination protein O)